MNRYARIGLDAAGELSEEGQRIIKAVAAMLDAATTKRKVKGKEVVEVVAPFSALELKQALWERTDGKLVVSVATASYNKSVQKMLAELDGLRAEDLDLIVDWINADGLGWWSVKPRWDHILKHFPKWLSQARQWDVEGRPQIVEGGDDSQIWKEYSG